jgi:hypothetical protein
MKPILQIIAGVFLGTLAAQWVLDEWRGYRHRQERELERQKTEEADRVREQQLRHIQEMFQRQGRQAPAPRGEPERPGEDDGTFSPDP